MSKMLNTVVLMGRLTATPELKTTASGISVTSFTLAVDRGGSGDDKATDFINVVAWRGGAEIVCRYFTKGRMAVVKGRLQTRKYTDKNGNNRTSTEVAMDDIYFADSAPSAAAGAHRSDAPIDDLARRIEAYSAPANGQGNPFRELVEVDGDLPF